MRQPFPARAFSNWIINWYRHTLRHPKYRWWIVLGTLAYLLNPLDVIPDALPLLGWIDDGVIATVLVTEVSQLVSDRLKIQKNRAVVESNTGSTVDVKAVSIR